MSMDVRIAALRALWPDDTLCCTVRALSEQTGAVITITDDPVAAIKDNDVKSG
jgi:ornithine carbamoyltransferase